MSLKDQVQQTVKQFGIATDCTTIRVQEADQTLTCLVDAVDQLALAFRDFELFDARIENASMDRLSEVSQNLSSQLTYLLEPITPIEIDADRCVVQMRSNPPTRDDDRRSYYELLVQRDGRLCLNRYAKPNGGMRAVISAQVTREVFDRLVGDFASAAD